MPRFAIAIGGQNHVFEGPNADAAARFARQWARDNPQAVNAGWPGDRTLGGYVDTFNRAVPGLSEMGAGLAAGGGVLDDLMAGRPVDFGARWSQARAHQQSQIDQLRNDHPIAANMTTGLGLAAPVLAALASGGAAAPVVARSVDTSLSATAARLAGSAGRNAFSGAVAGGVYGASEPGSLRQRLGAANDNLLPGAAIGLLAPALLGASRAGIAGVRALRGKVDPTPGFDALPGGVEGTEPPKALRLPSSVIDTLGSLPEHIIAEPDDEFAIAHAIQDVRSVNSHPEVRRHFMDNAYGALIEPVWGDGDDEPFKGYTGGEVANIHSRLSDLSDHYRPQGKNGAELADQIDRFNGSFLDMTARAQPEFAKAMARDSEPSRVVALNPPRPAPVVAANLLIGKAPREFDAANLMASAVNDNVPEEETSSKIAGSGMAVDPVVDENVLQFRRPFAKKEEEGEFDPDRFMRSAANDNIPQGDQPLEALSEAPFPVAEDYETRKARFETEVGPDFLPAYNSASPAQQRQIEAFLRSLASPDTNVPLPPGVVNFPPGLSADPGLSPTFENAASRSVSAAGNSGGAPNAFTGAGSGMDMASMIAARTPGTIGDPKYDFRGPRLVLPLSKVEQESADTPVDEQDQ